ncbi:MAG: RND transporter [Deltaproteobacteria bacterium SG8_13]|nr:MAG: RND transporter [Deltaproteobacteria bacterium SG8_13]
MNRTARKIFRWILPIVIIAAIGFAIWHYTRPDPIEVVVRPVQNGQVEKIVANTRAGTVEACRRAKLSPSIGGQIARLPVKKGDRVAAGQLLLELWNEDLAANAALAESEAAVAKSRANASCLEAEVAQREAKRLLALRKSGAASEDQTDRAVTQAKALAAGCSAAKATVKTSREQVGVAQANLARTRLIAPFDGVIAEINGELSEYVTPSPIGIATPPAVDLIDTSCFYVKAPIDEVDAAAVQVDLPSRITLDAFRERSFSGRVRRIADYVLDREKQARTVDVEVEFTRPEDFRHLLAGYSADVEVILDARADTLRIPTQAVLDGRRVFVFLPDQNRIQQRNIQTGLSNWEFTEVTTGLQAGELVVVNVDRAGIADNAHAVVMKETR